MGQLYHIESKHVLTGNHGPTLQMLSEQFPRLQDLVVDGFSLGLQAICSSSDTGRGLTQWYAFTR